MANPVAGKFTIWQANPTTDQSLVAVNDNNEVFDPSKSCATTPTASLTTNNPTAAADKQSGDNGKSTLSSGAIAGIAVGGAVVALVCASLLWLFIRKRWPSTNQQSSYGSRITEDAVQEAPKPDNEIGYPSQGIPHFIPQEMSAVGRKSAPIEMPG
jgi:hypothetical protein